MGSAQVSEPDRKRVRFDHPSDRNDSSPPRPPEPAKHTLPASDVVQLRFLTDVPETVSAASPHPPSLTAHPTYLHQIIPNDQVTGWKSLTVAVYVHLPTLFVWIDQTGTHAEEEEPMDVPSLLAPYVRNGLCSTSTQFLSAIAASHPMPLTTPVASYQRGDRAFSIYKEKFFASEDGSLTKRTAFLNFHMRMAFLMFVHIDGASFIDHEDPRWEIFVVAQVVDGKPASFAGYATTYPFSALAKGDENRVSFAERIRVSQVFISPLSQSSGHGGRLLNAIYDDARSRGAMEITVEDPSRGFRLLRDVTDLKRCYSASILESAANFVPEEEESLCQAMRTRLLLTPGQARRCLEVHRLRFTDREDEDVYKKYRLWVKRRLYAAFLEVLDQFDSKEKKEKLAEIYQDLESEYLEAMQRLEPSLKRAASQSEQREEKQPDLPKQQDSQPEDAPQADTEKNDHEKLPPQHEPTQQ